MNALSSAVDTAWSIYRATHRDVDASDGRRCVLERHRRMKWEAGKVDTGELACSGLAYLEQLREAEC
jgi:hypothetical protein